MSSVPRDVSEAGSEGGPTNKGFNTARAEGESASDPARSAGVRKEERLASGLDTAGIVQAAKVASEIATTLRVYRKEWLFDSRHVTRALAETKAVETYGGRLREEDLDVREDPNARRPWTVWTRRWNVASEWKDEDRANLAARTLREQNPGQEVEVVTRNGRQEVMLQQYGILKLAKT